MSYKHKTLRRWFVLVTDEKTFKTFRCPSDNRLEVVDGVDLLGPIKRYYELDSEHLLSDRQLTIKINQLKRSGYVEEN